MTLTLKNVAWKDNGDVVCSQPCYLPPPVKPTPLPIVTGTANGVTFCAGDHQYFRLQVFPSASELFPVPMSNVSVRRKSDAQIACVANRLEGNSPAFIWRFNGHLIAAPAGHPMQALVRILVTRLGKFAPTQHFPLAGISNAKEFNFGVSYSYTVTTVTSTLSISSVDFHTSARVECWVRPDEIQEVWRRQTAFLHVSTIPAA
ncbi:uncharacterized protein LOC129598179 isoform X2 [Paramacrobiotus metropolitanus]|uniref:uncharacterized protein LOC129598179 isoform X2 n=1 Tax=Paramacrobiotus metropolitanus TaxID=2943436 RepID=UPI002446509D|nr:uncharacterized protein LOC129598179 isoform X2 [Paramacrobiotus metropolitanus]